jgi:putative transposase
VLERALEAEMAAHLGFGKSERGGGAGNARNGTAFKTVQTGAGPDAAAGPPRPAGMYEPLLPPFSCPALSR